MIFKINSMMDIKSLYHQPIKYLVFIKVLLMILLNYLLRNLLKLSLL